MYTEQWLVLEVWAWGTFADLKIAGDRCAGGTKERVPESDHGGLEGGPRVFSLLAFLGWAEGCLLPTVSPRAELCLKMVVRASGGKLWLPG